MSIENGLAEQSKFKLKDVGPGIEEYSEYPLPEPCLKADVSGKSKPSAKKGSMDVGYGNKMKSGKY